MRKFALLFAVGALWLFVAALPVFADGGPHQMAVNNGTGAAGLTADSCAGCHRAHTATAANLLNEDQPKLCTDCHNGTKATTDVVNGVQFDPTSTSGAVLGALRGGGFEYALINSATPARQAYYNTSRSVTAFIGHVQVGASQPVTSTHEGAGKVWGNGAVNSGAGPSVALECGSCHNPHGNGQYRILQTKPSLTATSGSFALANAGGVEVQDTAYTGVRNYTVRPSTNGLAANVVAGTTGDYWRYKWDPTGAKTWTDPTLAADPMNTGWISKTDTYTNSRGVQWSIRYPVNSAEIAAYNTQLASAGVTDPVTKAPSIAALDNRGGLMTAWCIQCHTRYDGVSTVTSTAPNQSLTASSLAANSADATFMLKHGTTRVGCEQCHVSHGSNAAMTGGNSRSFTDPSGTVSAGSRLLKVNNRGTCQLCHDPTLTVKLDSTGNPLPNTPPAYIGPVPTPGN